MFCFAHSTASDRPICRTAASARQSASVLLPFSFVLLCFVNRTGGVLTGKIVWRLGLGNINDLVIASARDSEGTEVGGGMKGEQVVIALMREAVMVLMDVEGG